ncbi:hypothetical protein EON67_08260 [archaeon]|nr:MAG: hypothetical protein EON67_08260 [archaeon]
MNADASAVHPGAVSAAVVLAQGGCGDDGTDRACAARDEEASVRSHTAGDAHDTSSPHRTRTAHELRSAASPLSTVLDAAPGVRHMFHIIWRHAAAAHDPGGAATDEASTRERAPESAADEGACDLTTASSLSTLVYPAPAGSPAGSPASSPRALPAGVAHLSLSATFTRHALCETFNGRCFRSFWLPASMAHGNVPLHTCMPPCLPGWEGVACRVSKDECSERSSCGHTFHADTTPCCHVARGAAIRCRFSPSSPPRDMNTCEWEDDDVAGSALTSLPWEVTQFPQACHLVVAAAFCADADAALVCHANAASVFDSQRTTLNLLLRRAA